MTQPETPSTVTNPVVAADLSIVIPFRSDRAARRENLQACLAHLRATLPEAEVIVIEDAPVPDGPLGDVARWESRVNSGPFHRTRLLNDGMGRLATRRFVASWDTDVLIYPAAMAEALAQLRSGAKMVLPYDGHYFDARGSLRRELIARPDLADLPPAAVLAGKAAPWWRLACLHNANMGGAVIFDRHTFCASGGYHEGFVAWGFEDDEIATRMRLLGHGYRRVQRFPLIHLAHPRGWLWGWLKGNAFYRTSYWNRARFHRMRNLRRDEVEALIARNGLGLCADD